MRQSAKQSARAWLLIPTIIAAAVVIGVLVSSYQKEVGLVEPSPWERTAVAATAEAQDLSNGDTADDYSFFSRALLVAAIAHRNAPAINAADTRLNHILAQTLDCLYALREAWQADLARSWAADTHGNPEYWNALHPALDLRDPGPLQPDQLRRSCQERADDLLDQALDLAG